MNVTQKATCDKFLKLNKFYEPIEFTKLKIIKHFTHAATYSNSEIFPIYGIVLNDKPLPMQDNSSIIVIALVLVIIYAASLFYWMLYSLVMWQQVLYVRVVGAVQVTVISSLWCWFESCLPNLLLFRQQEFAVSPSVLSYWWAIIK